MSTIKSNGSIMYGLIAGAILRFRCYNALDLGQDSVSKIDVSCLDEDHKKYRKGTVDPGEGSITIQLDDENETHAEILRLAVESDDEVEFFVGSPGTEAPTVLGEAVTLPTTRSWLTFNGYFNPASPTIEVDAVWTYQFPLVRTSPVTTVLKTA